MLRSSCSRLICSSNAIFCKNNKFFAISSRSATTTILPEEDFTLEYFENDRKGIAVGTMKKVETRNALCKSLVTQFKTALDYLKIEKGINVLIIRSSVPRVFCAGADLKERLQMTGEEVSAFVETLRRISTDLSELPMPTIAALDGAALGGGLEYALSCDIRVASDSAKMGLVETSLAIIPGAGGTQRLPRLVGSSVAKDLIFTAKVLDGAEAHKIGLVNYVVPQNQEGNAAYLKALEVAERINANGPIALRQAKYAIDKGSEVDLKSGLAIEQDCYEKIIETKDRVEALKAFLEKRPKRFTGE